MADISDAWEEHEAQREYENRGRIAQRNTRANNRPQNNPGLRGQTGRVAGHQRGRPQLIPHAPPLQTFADYDDAYRQDVVDDFTHNRPPRRMPTPRELGRISSLLRRNGKWLKFLVAVGLVGGITRACIINELASQHKQQTPQTASIEQIVQSNEDRGLEKPKQTAQYSANNHTAPRDVKPEYTGPRTLRAMRAYNEKMFAEKEAKRKRALAERQQTTSRETTVLGRDAVSDTEHINNMTRTNNTTQASNRTQTSSITRTRNTPRTIMPSTKSIKNSSHSLEFRVANGLTNEDLDEAAPWIVEFGSGFFSANSEKDVLFVYERDKKHIYALEKTTKGASLTGYESLRGGNGYLPEGLYGIILDDKNMFWLDTGEHTPRYYSLGKKGHHENASGSPTNEKSLGDLVLDTGSFQWLFSDERMDDAAMLVTDEASAVRGARWPRSSSGATTQEIRPQTESRNPLTGSRTSQTESNVQTKSYSTPAFSEKERYTMAKNDSADVQYFFRAFENAELLFIYDTNNDSLKAYYLDKNKVTQPFAYHVKDFWESREIGIKSYFSPEGVFPLVKKDGERQIRLGHPLADYSGEEFVPLTHGGHTDTIFGDCLIDATARASVDQLLREHPGEAYFAHTGANDLDSLLREYKKAAKPYRVGGKRAALGAVLRYATRE